ncbi:unnamed protein product [Caenorhabditis bovis]|uniref:Gustatory receptor n=1 Tax=Caenorhabditis bovis TaxID=2654633 RepID=A0A8S1EAJ8_9PELO|nr:unnamed protein product [Caenorhabditis bovis]
MPSTTNIFGFYRYLIKISPLNCGNGPFRIVGVLGSLVSIALLFFRIIYLFVNVSEKTLSLGWAEKNVSLFMAFESLACLIAVCRITAMRSVERVEEHINNLKMLRRTCYSEVHDNYQKTWTMILIYFAIILIGVGCNAGYLATESSYYFIIDPAVSFICVYTNCLFIAYNILMHAAIDREVIVFNEELMEAANLKQLADHDVFSRFADRQVQLHQMANTMADRLGTMMHYAPFTGSLALLNGTFITMTYSYLTPTIYFVFLIFYSISLTTILSALLIPPARIQDTLLKTSQILMSDGVLQTSDHPKIYQIYRMMVDRSRYNRARMHFMHIFAINLVNVKRTLFTIAHLAVGLSILKAIVIH